MNILTPFKGWEKSLLRTLTIALIVTTLSPSQPSQAVPLDPNGDRSKSLDIDRYCRKKHGRQAWAEVKNNEHKWYAWKCVVPSGWGAGISKDGGSYNSNTSAFYRPVHLDDVCAWQYNRLFGKQKFVAFRIGENSGDIRCKAR